MRIGFLFNQDQIHQVAHSLPIALTLATLLGQIVGLRCGVPLVSWRHSTFLKPANRLLLRATRRLSNLWIGDSRSVTALTASRLKVKADRLATWPLFSADPTAPPSQTLAARRGAATGRARALTPRQGL